MRLEQLPTPCYVIDEAKLEQNLKILHQVHADTGAKILLAQKAFSAYAFYSLIGRYIQGTAASGLYEAMLGHEEMGLENHVFSAAYREDEMEQIASICDHVVLNSLNQLEKFAPLLMQKGCQIGLRINPQHATQEGHAIYDPCAPGSRLGVPVGELGEKLPDCVSGLHFHTLCEQNADALEETLEAVIEKFGKYFSQIQWLNFGGGHHITRPDYQIDRLKRCIDKVQNQYHLQIYLEPGEAVALNAGYLVTSVLDIVQNDISIAILDTSAACHMPDVLEMPYRPPLQNSYLAHKAPFSYRLAGPTCLAGDIIGDYSFDAPLKVGHKLIFEDMAIYTMVKNNTFNGMPLPSIAVQHGDGECEILRRFSYLDFKNRLS